MSCKPLYKAFLLLILLNFGNGSAIVDAAEHINGISQRTFRVDYTNNVFLKDDKPFRYVGGSLHYFRALPETWQKKLRTMRASGLNVVSTYVEWSLHNPKEGVYNWDGIADLVQFIRLAEMEDLLVILRPGPYICAERDMGGFPYWLLHKYPGIKLRTMDNDYMLEVNLWYQQLMPRIDPYLYENGGPIIMVQVENEYGSYACDQTYRRWVKNVTEHHVRGKAVLFTNDGPDQLPCGKIEGVLATLDFGNAINIDGLWNKLRKYQPNGPLVNSEYYPGWLSHWQEKFQRVPTKPVVDALKKMLDRNASVNFYMFYGGTNFGYTAGANDGGPGAFNADLTSYDYDAPMNEAGDPTPKFYAIRDAVGAYLPLPNVSLPVPEEKMSLDPIRLHPVSVLLSPIARRHLGSPPVTKMLPVSFEELNQYSGFVLYETVLPRFKADPSTLKVDKLRDRAYVYVDRNFVGVLSRESQIDQLPLNAGSGNALQILVENQGRINYNVMNDFKGILGFVTLNGRPLVNWTITGYPLESHHDIQRVIDLHFANSSMQEISGIASNRAFLRTGPTIFGGKFQIAEDLDIMDTYLDPTGWGKGIAFINGFNLGRYWPVIGPQITLYVPKEILKYGDNRLTLIELQKSPENGDIAFTNTPKLDG